MNAFLSLYLENQIIISFPIAFFFWSTIMGQKYYNILQMMVLFIILGIGADDIFVLQDAWRQSAVQKDTISVPPPSHTHTHARTPRKLVP